MLFTEIHIEDYFQVQNLLDEGLAIKEGRKQYKKHVMFFKRKFGEISEEAKYLTAVLKSTVRGDELYLQTLYISSPRELSRAQKRGLQL